MPRFSIIVTSFNRPRLVRDAVASCLEQSLEDIEVVVMDDGPGDETRAAIEEAAGGDGRVKIVWGEPAPLHERAGQHRYSMRINQALAAHVTGDYVRFLCDDDYAYPDSCRALAAALDEHPECIAAAGRLRSISYDAEGLWDSSAPPKPGRSYPEYGHTDPESGRPVNEAHFVPGIFSSLEGFDHNQVAVRLSHVRSMQAPWWPESACDVGDAGFFRKLTACGGPFVGVDAMVATKRYHARSLGRVGQSAERE